MASESSQTPYIGSKISLISKMNIRYEGTLHSVDPVNSTISLYQVKSFGTEERESDHQVPKRDEVFEYIIFKASDILDLIVCDTLKDSSPDQQENVLYDPAIVSIQQQQIRLESGTQLPSSVQDQASISPPLVDFQSVPPPLTQRPAAARNAVDHHTADMRHPPPPQPLPPPSSNHHIPHQYSSGNQSRGQFGMSGSVGRMAAAPPPPIHHSHYHNNNNNNQHHQYRGGGGPPHPPGLFGGFNYANRRVQIPQQKYQQQQQQQFHQYRNGGGGGGYPRRRDPPGGVPNETGEALPDFDFEKANEQFLLQESESSVAGGDGLGTDSKSDRHKNLTDRIAGMKLGSSPTDGREPTGPAKSSSGSKINADSNNNTIVDDSNKQKAKISQQSNKTTGATASTAKSKVSGDGASNALQLVLSVVPAYDRSKSFFDDISCETLEKQQQGLGGGHNQKQQRRTAVVVGAGGGSAGFGPGGQQQWRRDRATNQETFGLAAIRQYRATTNSYGGGGKNYATGAGTRRIGGYGGGGYFGTNQHQQPQQPHYGGSYHQQQHSQQTAPRTGRVVVSSTSSSNKQRRQQP